MGQTTGIQWTDRSSNPLRYRDAAGQDVWACVKKSTGCAHCYSETLALRYGKGSEFTAANMRVLTPYVRDKELKELLSPKKTPAGSKVFACDMTDLFGDWMPFELVDRVFAAFALRRDVVFQVLTKRPDRMAEYLADDGYAPGWVGSDGPMRDRVEIEMVRLGAQFDCRDTEGFRGWYPLARDNFPLPNVWLGTSVENQQQADERIPHLLRCPARVRFLSCEPLLGPVDLTHHLRKQCTNCGPSYCTNWHNADASPGVHWVIVGGESGPDARTCRVEWMRSLVERCRATSVPVFVKQLGEHATTALPAGECWPGRSPTKNPQFSGDGFGNYTILGLKDRKGGDPAEWPAELRVRQFPEVSG